MIRYLIISLAAALVFSTPVVSQESSASAEGALRAGELLGSEVATRQGEALGRIAGLLIDTRPRGQHYALLSYRGDDGLEKRFAYPVNALRRDGNLLKLPVAQRNLAESPGYLDGRWPAREARSGERYVHARQVIGKPVLDPLGRQVGVLRDASISLDTARTQVFMIDFADGGVLPMPAHAVRLSPAGPVILNPDSNRRS